ncbi:hypothetical protein OOZ15_11995 [Galbibacter sp. EGI 63066]|uniref:hypothetical protein n=1 Tax=Galbibacter sp. EGI 63066 TaxID=2993559 RepID=UPI0022496DB6|nr:hypothetical protein [Galbibacter sp. EGI 63066]MCX2680666.1 hypothetical protein [Galbibacter sp. EGI 63066]
MAKQDGIIKLKGTMDGVTFYKTADGYVARKKGGIDKKRLENHPAFQRTRENNAEFARAGLGSKLIRKAILPLLKNAKDPRVNSRLTKELLAIIKTDTVNGRGLRTIADGVMEPLEGFNFNGNGKLDSALYSAYALNLDRVAGSLQLQIDAFTANEYIIAPSGTMHFEIVLGMAELDFNGNAFVFNSNKTAITPWGAQEVPAIDMSANVTADSTLPLLQVMGVNFYQEVNGQMYPLRNGSFNALAVVGIDKP